LTFRLFPACLPALLSLPQMTGASPYTACAYHPDGLLMVTGTADAKAQIWEMRQQNPVTGFDTGRCRRPVVACMPACPAPNVLWAHHRFMC
jgi:hypothetical protein